MGFNGMSIRTETAVRTIVEAMLPRWSGDLGLLVSLDVNFYRYDEEGDDKVGKRTMCDFLFIRQMNYTKVLYREWARFTDKTDQWKLIGDHDSCWPDSVSRAIQEVSKEADEICKEVLGDSANSEYITFGIGTPKYYLVDCKINPGQEDSKNL